MSEIQFEWFFPSGMHIIKINTGIWKLEFNYTVINLSPQKYEYNDVIDGITITKTYRKPLAKPEEIDNIIKDYMEFFQNVRDKGELQVWFIKTFIYYL